jgi:AcrR family transcriptional regulator
MEPNTKPRAYDASRRRDQAERTRVAIVAEAERLFLAHGYGGTSIASVAAGAGVSVETIYKAFGGKPGLVEAIYERALRGDGAVPAETRSDAIQAAEPDPRVLFERLGDLIAELTPRAAPIALLIRDAAAADPALEPLRRELDDRRLVRMTVNARRLHAGGRLRAGLTVDVVADVLWTATAAELYELLVLRRGWPLARYRAFVVGMLGSALL